MLTQARSLAVPAVANQVLSAKLVTVQVLDASQIALNLRVIHVAMKINELSSSCHIGKFDVSIGGELVSMPHEI